MYVQHFKINELGFRQNFCKGSEADCFFISLISGKPINVNSLLYQTSIFDKVVQLLCHRRTEHQPPRAKSVKNVQVIMCSMSANYSCPLCTTVSLSLGLLLALSWLLRLFSTRFVAPAGTRRIPPRYTWPSANPRASPALLFA